MTSMMINEIYRVMAPGSRLITFSLHALDEVIIHYNKLNWKVYATRVKSSRWNESKDESKKAVAHTMIICDKPLNDGVTYVRTLPIHIEGTLTDDEYEDLLKYADEVICSCYCCTKFYLVYCSDCLI